jgi:valine dehydrogenase (NAD+)
VKEIFTTTTAVLAAARAEGITTLAAANRLAERRMAEVGRIGMIRSGSRR